MHSETKKLKIKLNSYAHSTRLHWSLYFCNCVGVPQNWKILTFQHLFQTKFSYLLLNNINNMVLLLFFLKKIQYSWFFGLFESRQVSISLSVHNNSTSPSIPGKAAVGLLNWNQWPWKLFVDQNGYQNWHSVIYRILFVSQDVSNITTAGIYIQHNVDKAGKHVHFCLKKCEFY